MANHQSLTGPQAKKKRLTMFISLVMLLLAIAGYLYWGNTTITVTQIEVADTELPAGFDGFTMVHISDLHNTEFGEHQERLLEKIAAASPDLIAITGDLLDSYHPDLAVAMDFIDGVAQIAPVYYVTGNHESRLTYQYSQLKQHMEAAGVTILANQKITLESNGSTLTLLGLDDPSFAAASDAYADNELVIRAQLTALLAGEENYTILLSHRPELLDIYKDFGIGLVLSGHAHGGQVRLSLIGALFAPNQGLFPQYTAGLYSEGATKMVVSRGLGNSSFPLRINNPPELVVITLKADYH